MKIGVVGSRGWQDLDAVVRFVACFADNTDDPWFISGGADDVDDCAESTAKAHGFAVTSFRPHETPSGLWTIHRFEYRGPGLVKTSEIGRVFSGFAPAAFFRNGLIVEECYQLVAFWDGESHGTADSIKKAESAGKLAHIFYPTSRVGRTVG